MVVVHYTAMSSLQAAAERLCDPAHEVSAHYLIGRCGTVLRLVAEEMRAWHAGAGQWGDVTDINSRSIGIELDNDGRSPFAAAQMDALEDLLGAILARHDIQARRVIGHSDMAPARKSDPGPRFDWARLARQGLAIGLPHGFFWPEISPPRGKSEGFDPCEGPPAQAKPALGDLGAALTAIGYAPDLSGDLRLHAFRLRFAPHLCGPASPLDLAAAQYIARHFPVDQSAAEA